MSQVDFVALLPIIVPSAFTVLVMLVTAFRRDNALAAGLTVTGLAATLTALPMMAAITPRYVTPLYLVDGFGLFFIGLLLFASLIVAILSYGYLEQRTGGRDELYMLLMMATLGGIVLVCSIHFASLFIGLELLTVPLYAMVGFTRNRRRSIEAAVKYLVLAGASSAFLLFGMALIYAETGSMEFGKVLSLLKTEDLRYGVLLAGMAMMGVAVGFKLALVPFHLWTPDVYEGAPAPVTAYVATASKGAITAVLLRFYILAGGAMPQSLLFILSMVAVASMFVGNLMALLQVNVKRILAYSSIAHLGYLLVAFLCGGAYAVEAAAYYLVAYVFTSLGTFGIIAVLSDKDGEPEMVDDYTGLFWRRPLLAGIFAAMLLSLAGVPLTAGFAGKFYILASGVDTGAWLLLTAVVINSAIGLFYYLRIVAAMYQAPEETVEPSSMPTLALTGSLILSAVALIVLWMGTYPASLISLIRATVTNLV